MFEQMEYKTSVKKLTKSIPRIYWQKFKQLLFDLDDDECLIHREFLGINFCTTSKHKETQGICEQEEYKRVTGNMEKNWKRSTLDKD
ncbi:hypothetical protein J0S82_004456, partial [Galemys pyrenaicus]